MIEYNPTQQTTELDESGMHVSDLLDLMADLELQAVEADMDMRFRYERMNRLTDYSPY